MSLPALQLWLAALQSSAVCKNKPFVFYEGLVYIVLSTG